MQAADEITHQLEHSNRLLRACKCGCKPVLLYEPGLTSIACSGCGEVRSTLPDWQPERIAQRWNRGEWEQ